MSIHLRIFFLRTTALFLNDRLFWCTGLLLHAFIIWVLSQDLCPRVYLWSKNALVLFMMEVSQCLAVLAESVSPHSIYLPMSATPAVLADKLCLSEKW